MGRDIVVWRFGPKVVDIRVVDCRPVSAACPLLQSHPIFPSTPPQHTALVDPKSPRFSTPGANSPVHASIVQDAGPVVLAGSVALLVSLLDAMRRCTAGCAYCRL